MIGADLSPLANHLWQSTLCAGAAWLLALALRRNRAAVRYGIWMAASLKFLVPFAWLIRLGHRFGWQTVPATLPPQIPVMLHIGRPFVQPISGARVPSIAPATHGWVEMLLFAVWLGGFLLGAVHWFRWWWSLRRDRRMAVAIDLHLPVTTMESATRREPGVCGIWKPVLLLPAGIRAHLAPAELQAVLAHELCHVRRRDNFTAAVHMVTELLFWFHPLVWCIRARLVEERERACDEYVLNGVSEARVYAEAILTVCKFYLELPLVCAAGVTGSNLKRRIEFIMAGRAARRLDPVRKVLLALAGAALILAPFGMGIMDAPLRAQSKSGSRPAFAVASIKQDTSNDSHDSPHSFQFLPGGRFVVRNLPLFLVITDAYHLPFQSGRLVGGPDWIRDDRYDIEASADGGAIPAGATVTVRDEKMRQMVQTLLAERFQMKIRREVKEMPVYAVVVGKNGPKLQKAARQEVDCADSPTGLGFENSCHSFAGGMGRGLHAQAVSIADVALAVSNWADRPVIDKTGLEGLFRVETEGWAPMNPRPPRPQGQEPTAEERTFADPATPTLFQIFDRMGLKLERQRAPVETIVIESIQRPSEN